LNGSSNKSYFLGGSMPFSHGELPAFLSLCCRLQGPSASPDYFTESGRYVGASAQHSSPFFWAHGGRCCRLGCTWMQKHMDARVQKRMSQPWQHMDAKTHVSALDANGCKAHV